MESPTTKPMRKARSRPIRRAAQSMDRLAGVRMYRSRRHQTDQAPAGECEPHDQCVAHGYFVAIHRIPPVNAVAAYSGIRAPPNHHRCAVVSSTAQSLTSGLRNSVSRRLPGLVFSAASNSSSVALMIRIYDRVDQRSTRKDTFCVLIL